MNTSRVKSLLILLILLQPIFGICQDRPGTLLREVSKPGVPHTSYLFGTFHEINATFFSSLPNAVAKLDQSQVLFVEEKKSAAQDLAGASQLAFWSREQWESILNAEQEKFFASLWKKPKIRPTISTLPCY